MIRLWLKPNRAGFRSRAALKLEQMDKKHNILTHNAAVLDLGCAPGGWLQYASQKIGLTAGHGRLVGIDLLDTDPVAGADILKGDINDDAMMHELIRLLGGKADVVLSDMAADTTGHRPTDHCGPQPCWILHWIWRAAF